MEWADESTVRRQEPKPDALGFDARLMSGERLLQLAGQYPLKLGTNREVRSLDCGQCGRAVDILTDEAGGAYRTTPMQILAATLRHQVMSHGQSLSGGDNG